jgi:hypothetical protein
VHVDVLVLSSGGNLLDSLALALCAVLSETLLPKVRIGYSSGISWTKKWKDHWVFGCWDLGTWKMGIFLENLFGLFLMWLIRFDGFFGGDLDLRALRGSA